MTQTEKDTEHLSVIVLCYYLTLAVIAAASFSPGKYWWGISTLAYVSDPWRWVLLVCGGLLPITLIPLRHFLTDTHDYTTPSNMSRTYWIFAVAYTLISGIVFWLSRTHMHFLGDGYTVLSTLASTNPYIKYREIGESLIHIQVKELFGTGETAALFSFQVLSVAAGFIYLIILFITSQRFFQSLVQRICFVVATSTVGYMLLFFGYVEYYSLFVMSVGCYCLVGMTVALGSCHRWLVLPILSAAILLHVLGVVLLPSAVYLFLSGTKAGRTIDRSTPAVKLTLGILILVLACVFFYYFYRSNYFFRFAFVPFVSNRFTVDGYTLFSGRHLLDIVNLLFLLLPSGIIAAAVLVTGNTRDLLRRREFRFGLILIISVVGALFLFDPKLGMPRDWDLFSFAGVPVAIFTFYYVLVLVSNSRVRLSLVLLAVGLNLLVLVPRVIILTDREMALDQFRSYISWDLQKNRNALSMLVSYYIEQGDSTRAQEEYARVDELYPEWNLNRIGLERIQERRHTEALEIFRQVIEINPMYAAGYSNLGSTFLNLKQYDSAIAYYRIAEGMNPYNPKVLNGLGTAHYQYGNEDDAERLWWRTLKYDSTQIQTYFGLMELYQKRGNRNRYFECMAKAASSGEAPVFILKQLGEYYLGTGKYSLAREVYGEAMQKGLDSNYFDSIRQCYPQLER